MSKEQPEAIRLADALYEQSEHHFEAAQHCDMRPCDTLNWEHFETNREAAVELRRLHAENEALRAQIGQGVPVGVVGAMPGTDGFTMACFHADKVPVGSKLYTHPAPQQKPLTDEQDRALCEAYCNAASDEYFKARPQLDSSANRRIFYAGHRKAWIEWQAAHHIGEKK